MNYTPEDKAKWEKVITMMEETLAKSAQRPFFDTFIKPLKEEEDMVLKFLKEDIPVSYDQLLEKCPMEERQLRHVLIELELQGFLCQPDKNIFLKNRF
jgi:hypothetical protein